MFVGDSQVDMRGLGITIPIGKDHPDFGDGVTIGILNNRFILICVSNRIKLKMCFISSTFELILQHRLL